jgi:hypothetical protein
LLRAVLLSAGLAAALTFAALRPDGDTRPGAAQAAWVEYAVQSVQPGAAYRLDACFTIAEPGVTFVSLRVAWHQEPNGYGASIYQDDLAGWPGPSASEQCVSLADAKAPCAAVSARYGVIATGNASAVDVSSIALTAEGGSSDACPTTPPRPSPTPTPTPRPAPTPKPPSPTPPPASQGDEEARVFESLVNGGFERLRGDGTPYGWRKVGGTMAGTSAAHAQGARSASLTSATESTKWLYQTVTVHGGEFYRLRAKALVPGDGAREVMLRISWYASADGSGNQIETADSEPLPAPSSGFVEIDTGPAQAPPEARSAKVRLLLRPASSARAAAYFDDVRFGETALRPLAPAEPEADTSAAEARPSGGGAAYTASQPRSSGALPVAAGPLTLANVKPVRDEPAGSASTGRLPLWPLLLAIGAPAAGIALMAAGELRRSRIDGTDEPTL